MARLKPALGANSPGGHAGHDAVLGHILHRIVVPGALRYIVKAGVRLQNGAVLLAKLASTVTLLSAMWKV